MKNKNIVVVVTAVVVTFIAACGGATKVATNGNSSTGAVVAKSEQSKPGETIIVDVRTVGEWDSDGHANCSVNIPLDQLESRIGELKKDQKVVLVCRSGGRAGKAKEMLETAGFSQVENLGAWQNVNCK